MISKRLARASTVAAALLACTRAVAVDVSGSLDSGYQRTDSWAPGQSTVTVPIWNYGGSFSVSGAPLRPGLLTLDAGGDYRKIQTYYSAAPSDSSNWGYHGAARLFSDSPLSLTLSANRGWSDFTSQVNSPGVASVQSTGATYSRGEGVSALYRPDLRLPVLTLSYNRNTSEFSGFSQPVTSNSSSSLAVGAAQTVDMHGYSINYSTGWNSGSFADTNYRSHNLNITEESHLSKGLEFRLSEQYFLRDPTVSAAVNPRIDDNSLSTGLYWKLSDPLQTFASYGYHRLVAEAPGTSARESLGDDFSVGAEYRYSKRLTLTGNAGASYANERLGAASYKGTGEQVGGGARYTDTLGEHEAWYANGGLNVGLLQPAGGSVQGAYGVSGAAGLTTSRARWHGNAGYSLSYANNLGARAGSSVTQSLNAGAGTTFYGARLESMLNASATRYDDSLLGANLNRTVNFTLGAQWRRSSLQFNFGLSDGLSRTLTGGSSSDGLFLPVGYDTHARYANANAGFQLARGLNASLLARWAESSAPGRPNQYERGGALNLDYAIGAFVLSASENYSTGGQGGMTQSGNSFFLRVSRAFSAKL